MLINLSEVLSEQHKSIDQYISVEMDVFRLGVGKYPIVSKETVHITIEHVKDRELLIKGTTSLMIEMPCDRCLAQVPVKFELDFAKDVDLSESDAVKEDGSDETNYIDGYNLDVDKLLYNEILIGWPMKVLCKETCKGICSVCGQNLNKGACRCENTSLDPRMSVIRDVFKNFKEV